jgi:hypothetical protein
LGIGLSTLGKWVRAVSEEAKVPAQDAELLRENERLRKENRILRDLSRNRKRSGGLFSGECGRCQSMSPSIQTIACGDEVVSAFLRQEQVADCADLSPECLVCSCSGFTE